MQIFAMVQFKYWITYSDLFEHEIFSFKRWYINGEEITAPSKF